ncbi:L-serine dehydratase [Giardia muris]|uniref:L-serine dehydratase n=1 Tax=Giardia muris TaxID=5742 RepID=A0A4Z1SRQ1_GIAMU|nr:L-serine dehydratase [Giardia muris]|eukprot:TNJ28582.1 L-serine dehydratase [Giardia muris]
MDVEDFKAKPALQHGGKLFVMDSYVPNNITYPKSLKRMESLRLMYKIGYGPSSSHTMGPRFASERFAAHFPERQYFCTLYGSLAQTGRGHLTDAAIADVLKGCQFTWLPTQELPRHTNGMLLEARDEAGNVVGRELYYSIGGGSIEPGNLEDLKKAKTIGESSVQEANAGAAEIAQPTAPSAESPYKDFLLFSDIRKWCKEHDENLHEFVYRFDEPTIKEHLGNVWNAMKEAVERGLSKITPIEASRHLHYPRKAHAYYARARQIESMYEGKTMPERMCALHKNLLLLAYTLAVSEENGSAGGNVVTAPTCGACGVVPGCMYYYYSELDVPDDVIVDALATGGIIGTVAKCNGSVSGAEAGCQAEIGVGSSMAAAAICYLLHYLDVRSGKPALTPAALVECAEVAATASLQHALGMTCDPVMGIVVEPCIERNGAFAQRAHHAAELALAGAHDNLLSWDEVIHTMLVTGHDIPFELRESSQGGLAHFYCLDDITDGAMVRSTGPLST